MGTITVFGQLTTFGLSVLLGVLFCLLYDVFRALHIEVFRCFWSVFISDILYWMLILFFAYSFLLIFCNGNVRVYVLFGNALGFALCRFTLSKLFVKFCIIVVRLIRKLIEYIQIPFVIFSGIMSIMYEKLCLFSKKIVNILFKKKKKHLERDNTNGV